MKQRIILPGDLRDRALAALSNHASQLSDNARNIQATNEEIQQHDTLAAECLVQVAALKTKAVADPDAAASLASVERRLALIHENADRLRQKRNEPSAVPLAEMDAVLLDILYLYMDALKESFASAVAPFGYPPHLSATFLGHSEAFQVLRLIRD